MLIEKKFVLSWIIISNQNGKLLNLYFLSLHYCVCPHMMSPCLSLCLSSCLSLFCVCLSVSVCLFACMYVCLSLSLSSCPIHLEELLSIFVIEVLLCFPQKCVQLILILILVEFFFRKKTIYGIRLLPQLFVFSWAKKKFNKIPFSTDFVIYSLSIFYILHY